MRFSAYIVIPKNALYPMPIEKVNNFLNYDSKNKMIKSDTTDAGQIFSKLNILTQSPKLTFDYVASLKNIMGVYIILNDHNEVLYIGSTNKFNIRFGTDLKHETTHTFVQKLIASGEFSDRYRVLDYLKSKCMIRIEECDTKRKAEALEHLAIFVLQPRLNK